MAVPCSKQNGFTLIELMVVLAIVAVVISMAMPYLSNRNTQTKGILRELVVLSKQLHTKAKLQGAVFRLVIEMQEDSGGKRKAQAFWVERANGKTVLRADEEGEAAIRLQDKEPKPDPRGFEMDKSILKEPKQLPLGMTFEKIELTRLTSPITHGRAFIHYMPQGLVDEAAIHIKGENNSAWTIAIHPLTGKAELIAKPLDLQEIKSQ